MTHRPVHGERLLAPFLLAALLAAAPSVIAQTPPPPAPAEAEVGPYGLARASWPEEGVLAAGQPTAEQLAALAAAGFKTVVDLRGPDEDRGFDEAATAAALGLEYRVVPVDGELDPAAVEAALAAVADAPRPMLLHCGTSNRVGGLYYVHLVRQGVPPEEALRRAHAAGLRSAGLAEAVRAWAEEHPAPAAEPGEEPAVQ